ncbi:MAG TPA: MBL fold metallo-hydrolase [Desulfobacterales bacterium]|nr:MBL fold metallo-hydrolase [Desulfobacterales bacterium]
MKKIIGYVLTILLLPGFSFTAHAAGEPKAATPATRAANAAVLKALPFQSMEDFENAKRGFIAELPGGLVKGKSGRKRPHWDLNQYEFLKGDAPDTVNPSLWRQAQLNMKNGLFKVTDRVYQVRGYDLSNISFIEGDTGWIVIDPLVSAETAKAALDLVDRHLGKKPIHTVIYTHSHVDHYGGVRGIVSEADEKAGKVKILAPEGFLEHAVSENVIAGNAMSRRAHYMYGAFLKKGPKGQVDAGLGKGTSMGSVGLIAPTEIISKTGQEMTIDGVKIIFQVTPGTEAPAEMNIYFPQFKALCMAENVTHTLHNLYTLRGAQVRDAKAWAYYINEAKELFGDKAEVEFASHHWPVWGKEKINDLLKKQRDLYKYLHDQTLRLANNGFTLIEIAGMIELPESLGSMFANRDYYGTVSHNVRAVYNKYLGYFDGNPANLNPLPPEAAGRKYVEFMGGAESVINKSREAFNNGEYRWVAQVMSHVVFADPNNQAARDLEADALEQLGYQSESAPWRNFYLMGAQELRHGVQKIKGVKGTATPDTVKAMTVDMFFDFLAVRLNGPKAAGKTLTINWEFTDTGEKYVLSLENSVLNYVKGKVVDKANAGFILSRATLNEIVLGKTKLDDKIAGGEVKVAGRKEALGELMALMDKFDIWFNIVLP